MGVVGAGAEGVRLGLALKFSGLACLLAAQPVFAAQPPAPTPDVAQPTSTFIPFAPPLGQVIRYKVIKTVTRTGIPERRFESIQSIRFEKRKGQIEMHWQADDVTNASAAPLDPIARIFSEPAPVPLVFAINTAGDIGRILDWERQKEHLKKAHEAMFSAHLKTQVPAERPLLLRMMTGVSNQILDAGPDKAGQVLIADLLAAFGNAGQTVSLGESVEGSVQDMGPVSNTPITLRVKISVTALSPTEVTFTKERKADPNGLEKMVNEGLEPILRAVPPEQRGEDYKQLFAKTTLSVETSDQTVVTLDRASGMPLKLERQKTTAAMGKVQTEKLSIERVSASRMVK